MTLYNYIQLTHLPKNMRNPQIQQRRFRTAKAIFVKLHGKDAGAERFRDVFFNSSKLTSAEHKEVKKLIT